MNLEKLLPLACAWMREEEARILESGVELNEVEAQIARQIGVANPERVRLLQVLAMPEPSHPILRAAMEKTGFFTGNAAGLTLRNGIFIVRNAWRNTELIAHELVHVAQYEALGIEAFLGEYLRQVLSVGYWNAPLEVEAREVSERVLNAIVD